MTATEILREALEIYARSTLGPDRGLAEQLANQAYDMAAAVGRADPYERDTSDDDCVSLLWQMCEDSSALSRRRMRYRLRTLRLQRARATSSSGCSNHE